MQRDDLYVFNKSILQAKLTLEWITNKRLIEYSIFQFDYKARLRSVQISEDENASDSFVKMEHTDMAQKLCIDFTNANDTHAVVLTIDGFENFHTDSEAAIECVDGTDYSDFGKCFHLNAVMKSTYQGLCELCIYIDGLHADGRPRWVLKVCDEPMYAYSESESASFCSRFVVTIVPAFESFRYHLFPNVRSVCAALSSESLPSLKIKFLLHPDGVNRDQFTELIFNNLHENHPKLIEPDEAAYSVALIRELFNSIDFSGDELVSWEEFTAYVIQSIVVIKSDTEVETTLDEYVIEYEEDVSAYLPFKGSVCISSYAAAL